jgi:hypothetical protein
MPAPAASAGAARRPAPDKARLREALLARMRPTAEELLDAEWDAEIAALEAAGAETVPPPAEEPPGLDPGPLAAPPDGADAWLADLPGPLLDEYLAATEVPEGPEPIAAGFWNRSTGDGAGFASGGVVDDLPPGPTLAGLAADVCTAGLGRLSDDELIGLLRAARRLSSWSASVELAAAGDLMRRRLAQEAAGQAGRAEHADAEIAAALTLTGRDADRLLDLALTLRRLPLTARALADGVLDLPRVMVIADEVAGLEDEHLASVEARVLARAAGQTTTQLRAATRRAVIAADPAAARKRQERAQRDARVERWTEHAGTGALAGRDLPPTGALAADQHLTELARALHAAGLAGTMDELRARVFVALLTGQPVASLLPPGGASSRGGAAGPCGAGDTGSPSSPSVPGWPGGSSSPGGPGSTGGPDAPGAPVLRGMVNLTVPLGTWLGLGEVPGEVAGFGPVDAEDCRDLARAMAQHPGTRWCLTVIDHNGRPMAHGCARPRRGPSRGPQPPGGPGASGGPGLSAGVAASLAGVRLEWLETAGCAHRRESAGYRPAPSLRHLIQIRQSRCAFPGCGRPARGCDQDHTVPYEQGGRTCECNLAPLCRTHHQAKQAHGWRLDQPRPGIMTWTTPSGRRYTTGPSVYPG